MMASFKEQSVHNDAYYEDLIQVGKLFEVITNEETPAETKKSYCELFAEMRLNELLQGEIEGESQWEERFDFSKL